MSDFSKVVLDEKFLRLDIIFTILLKHYTPIQVIQILKLNEFPEYAEAIQNDLKFHISNLKSIRSVFNVDEQVDYIRSHKLDERLIYYSTYFGIYDKDKFPSFMTIDCNKRSNKLMKLSKTKLRKNKLWPDTHIQAIELYYTNGFNYIKCQILLIFNIQISSKI